MQYAATFGYRVWLRAQDPHIGKGGVAHDGEVATRLGLPAIPPSAETIALAMILALVRETGVRVHLCRLSTAEGVAMVRAARQEGLPITCDVAIHHLHLSDFDIGWFDAQCHLVPPLRGVRDRAALRAGLADGTVDLVCSDHAPVDDDGKQVPFGESEPGATGLELLLPLTLKWAAEDGDRPPRRAGAHHHRTGGAAGAGCRASRRRPAGRRLRLRSGRVLGGRAEGAEEPGQEHAVPGSRGSRPRALDAGRRAGGLRGGGVGAVTSRRRPRGRCAIFARGPRVYVATAIPGYTPGYDFLGSRPIR